MMLLCSSIYYYGQKLVTVLSEKGITESDFFLLTAQNKHIYNSTLARIHVNFSKYKLQDAYYIYIGTHLGVVNFVFFTFSVKTKYTRDRMFRISVFHKYSLSLSFCVSLSISTYICFALNVA